MSEKDVEHANDVYCRWKARQAKDFDIVETLRQRYLTSLGPSGGPSIDNLSRAAYEEIQWLRSQLYSARTRPTFGRSVGASDGCGTRVAPLQTVVMSNTLPTCDCESFCRVESMSRGVPTGFNCKLLGSQARYRFKEV